MMRGSMVFCSALMLLAADPASAADLLQSWQAAQQHDPEFAAARAAYEAGATKRDQARALWRPSVVLNAGVGRMSAESGMSGAQFSAPGFGQSSGVAFNTSVSNGAMERISVAAKQPLINRELRAQSRQLEFAAEMADAEWQQAQQALMLRVSDRYFEVLLAQESLRLLQQQQKAVDRALTEVRDRFQLGDVPVTDTHEAAARAESIKAQVLAAEMDLQIRQLTFADLTGAAPQGLATLKAAPGGVQSSLAPLDDWISAAKLHNPALLIQQKGQAVAREEPAKYAALSAPTLDLVAQVGRDRLHGSGDFGNAENTSNSKMIGLQLTIPLFTGGYRSARQAEALHLVDKARSEGDRLQQQITLQTRSAWLGLTVGAGRVAALEQARKASYARLDATRLGHSVGDRTTQELLNAENDATASDLVLLQASVTLALDRLKLAALAGQLDETELLSANSLLRQASAAN